MNYYLSRLRIKELCLKFFHRQKFSRAFSACGLTEFQTKPLSYNMSHIGTLLGIKGKLPLLSDTEKQLANSLKSL